jgi:hypothetical protein
MFPRSFESRIKVERKIMAKELPQFKHFELNNERYFEGWHTTTTSHQEFQLKSTLPKGYPEVLPALYVTCPLTLRKYGGGTINSIGITHSFHTLGNGPGGCIQICHFGPANWDASKTCIGVLFKGILWCEAYAVHLRTGLDISEIFDNWRRRKTSWEKNKIGLNDLLARWPGEKTLETSWDTIAVPKPLDPAPWLTLTT